MIFDSVLELGEAVLTGALLPGDTVVVATESLAAMSPSNLALLARIVRCGGIEVIPRTGAAHPFARSFVDREVER